MSEKNTSFVQSELSRRSMLKFGFAALVAGFAARSFIRPAYAAESAAESAAGKTLIAYFSRTGNTRAVAEQIHSRVGGDLFEVRAAHAYPESYRATTEQARRELDSNFRPELTAQVADRESYKTIFIGHPSWWGTMPMALFTFLESTSFVGKTLVPFCTHEGSGLSRSPADIARLCPGATILEGIAIRGRSAASAQGDIDKWLKEINLA